MSDLTVNIQTPSGFEVQGALIPDNITVEQVIAELLSGLSLPRAASGQPISYSLVLVNRGQVLRGDQTLQDGGVQYGDTIRLVTGAERSNGSQPSHDSDPAQNGGRPGVADRAWQATQPAVGAQNGQQVPLPAAAPPVAAPVVNNSEWPRDAAAVVNNDWPAEVAPVRNDDWPHDRSALVNNDWPRDAGSVATGNWPAEAQRSPAFEPAGPSYSFSMADPVSVGVEESKEPATALTHIEIDGGWTASELSEWLGKLELAYSRLNAFLCLSDEDITRAGSVAENKTGSGSLDGAFALLVAAGNRRSNSLKVSQMTFASEGTIDLTGEQPPIKIMTEIINSWRQLNLAANNGLRPDRSKPAHEAAAALGRRAEQLSAQGKGVFVEGFIHHALDAAREALEAMAKDIRIKKISWSHAPKQP